MKILSEPYVLILLLKRYKFDIKTMSTSKDKSIVYCPNELILPSGTIFNLKAIVNHYGDSPTVGHYTALVRDNKNEKFYHLDDVNITEFIHVPEEMHKTHYIVIYCNNI